MLKAFKLDLKACLVLNAYQFLMKSWYKQLTSDVWFIEEFFLLIIKLKYFDLSVFCLNNSERLQMIKLPFQLKLNIFWVPLKGFKVDIKL